MSTETGSLLSEPPKKLTSHRCLGITGRFFKTKGWGKATPTEYQRWAAMYSTNSQLSALRLCRELPGKFLA